MQLGHTFQALRAAATAYRTTKNSMSDQLRLGRAFLRDGNRNNKPLTANWRQVLMTEQDLYTGFSYAAIHNRASAIATLATENLMTKAAKPIMEAAKKKDELVEHPYLKTIDTSRTFDNFRFWYDISTYLDLEGVFYLMAIRNVGTYSGGKKRIGNVDQFKLLNPYEVHKVRNQDTLEVGGYIERHDGLWREIPPEMIIEIRMLNPFDRDEPYAMTDAYKDSQFTLKSSSDYTRTAIANNVNAPGIISTGIELPPEQFVNFKSRIQNHEKGEPLYGNGGGKINWNDMQIDLNKAALDKVNDMNLNIITAVSGTSKTMLGIEQSGVTRETARVQRDLFYTNHGIPQLQFIIASLNQDYKNSYESDYEENRYTIYIDSPLGADLDADIKENTVRQGSYKNYKQLRADGYNHDTASKFAAGEISINEIGEPTEVKEAPAIEATVTPPADSALDNEEQGLHDHLHEPLAVVRNQFDEQTQGIITSQQGSLQNVVINIEAKVASAVLNKVTKNAFEEQTDIISQDDKAAYINELEIALATFYGIIIPLYARSTLNRRITEFGLGGDFKLNNEVRDYIRVTAHKAADSHINTILDDLLQTIRKTYDENVKASYRLLVEAEKARLPIEQQDDYVKRLTAKGKDSDVYRLAQTKALEGSGQQQIISAIKNEYKDISTNRAKAIARSETNRAFTTSQFEADKQFIRQNNLEGRAYKKWTTRSGNPCAICLSLAARGPIPFGVNFADLGEEISATYEQDGKTRVLKQKINYQALSAGNAHTNCSCIYQLIIE